MDTDTYSNAGVVEYSNKGFVNVAVFLDAPSAVAKQFGVDAIPSTFLVTSEGERVRKWEGYLGPDEYRKGLDGALSAHKKLKEIVAKLKTDPDNFDLNKEAGGHYEALAQNRAAADALKKAAVKAPDAKSQAVLLARVLGQLYEVEISNELNDELLAVSSQLDKLDADGKLGLKGDALAGRAQAALNRERRDDAIKLFEEIVEKHPASEKAPVSLLWLADLYHHHQKDNAKAEKTIKRLLEKYPKSELVEDAKAFLEHMKEHKEK
jgi:tetratricopeptide (TPR) repeat protein